MKKSLLNGWRCKILPIAVEFCSLLCDSDIFFQNFWILFDWFQELQLKTLWMKLLLTNVHVMFHWPTLIKITARRVLLVLIHYFDSVDAIHPFDFMWSGDVYSSAPIWEMSFAGEWFQKSACFGMYGRTRVKLLNLLRNCSSLGSLREFVVNGIVVISLLS